MGKRSDTMETTRLATELLRRIPRSRKISASELLKQLSAQGIERDIRTIQRQMKALSEHFDIERDDRSRPYGYKWKERAQGLALTILSEQESLLLTLAEQHLRNLLPTGLMKSLDGFFAQAKSNLGVNSHTKREREWLSKVRVVSTTQPLLPPQIVPGVFEEVSNALYGNKWLKLKYKNADEKKSDREVMPLGLAQQGARLYLVCRDRDCDNERIFAVNRIISAKATTFTFVRPANFDLQKYDEDGRFDFGEGKRIRLTFRISKRAGLHLLESRLSKDQQVRKLGDEQYEISATVVETAVLRRWLLGFGSDVSDIRREPLSQSDAP